MAKTTNSIAVEKKARSKRVSKKPIEADEPSPPAEDLERSEAPEDVDERSMNDYPTDVDEAMMDPTEPDAAEQNVTSASEANASEPNATDSVTTAAVLPVPVSPPQNVLPSNMLLVMATVQVPSIKILFDALANILLDCNLEIIPVGPDGDDTNAGVKILALNHKEGMLVHVKLNASGFNMFNCNQKQVLGINIHNMHRIIRSMSNNDMLTIVRYSDYHERNKLNFVIENMEKKQKFEYSLQLMDIDRSILDITSAKFQVVVIMSSTDFQKVCRDMNGIEAKVLEISLVDNVFQIKGNGDIANGKAEFRDTKNNHSSITIKRKYEIDGVAPSADANDIIHGSYDLKNLLLFTKCTNLCNHIEIYMQNDYPLLIKYSVASLGYVHLVLSPRIGDE
jgi:proliferating cell nuclear antigen